MKVSMQHECPDAETLAAFDSGKLAESEFSPVAEHIEGCRECQAQLEQVNAGSGFGALLRSAAEPSDVKPLVDPATRNGNSKLARKLLDLGVIDHEQAAITFAQQDDSQSLTELRRAGAVTDFQARSIAKGKAAGLRLGDYIICDKLGEGGMGLVYKAEHLRMKRTVAIKLLPASATASREAVRRFQREAQAAAKLIHRNVVTAYDAGEDRGRHFLVMEHVQGESLSSLVRSHGPLPVAKALDYVRQTANALQYAHSQGIVHRDIKPGNILVDRQGIVKLLDLGLARIGDVASDPGSDDLTRSGQLMGTVDYMAPEQARSSRTADHRADIYGLGCTMYFLLAGRPPYRGNNPVETLLAHAEQPVPSLHAIRPDLSSDLEAVSQRMLAKNPARRYQSTAELIAAVDTLDPEVLATTGQANAVCLPPPLASPMVETLHFLNQTETDTLPFVRPVTPPTDSSAKRLRSARSKHRKTMFVATGISGLALAALLTIVIVLHHRGQTTVVVVTDQRQPQVTIETTEEVERVAQSIDDRELAETPKEPRVQLPVDHLPSEVGAAATAGPQETIVTPIEKKTPTLDGTPPSVVTQRTKPPPEGNSPADFRLIIHKGARPLTEPLEQTDLDTAVKMLFASTLLYRRKKFDFLAVIRANGRGQRFTLPSQALQTCHTLQRQAGQKKKGRGGGFGGGGGRGSGAGKGAAAGGKGK